MSVGGNTTYLLDIIALQLFPARGGSVHTLEITAMLQVGGFPPLIAGLSAVIWVLGEMLQF